MRCSCALLARDCFRNWKRDCKRDCCRYCFTVLAPCSPPTPPTPPSSVDFANFLLQVSHRGVMKSPLEEVSLNCTLIGENYWDKMSVELIQYAPESRVRHLRFSSALWDYFVTFCISWGKPLLKCISAELCISELIMLICNSARPLTICKMPYIFMKTSASGLRSADRALLREVWFGHNPSLCLESSGCTAPIIFRVYWIITGLNWNIKK